MKYKIKSYDESWGQIIVEFNEKYTVAIDLPIDENQNLPIGDALEELINSAAPIESIDRDGNLINGVTNAQDITVAHVDSQRAETQIIDLSSDIRKWRLIRLEKSDWTQAPDAQLSELELNIWREYRQVLRDIPQQLGFPENIIYGIAPNEEAR